MSDESKIFHESWYRIAGQRLALRSSVRVRRQMFRGSLWYVIFDPFNNQYYRLRPPAYNFVSRLTASRTVEDVWKEVIAADPEQAPGQEEVIQLLAQLYHANLLHYELPADSAKLFERYSERKQKIRQSTLMSIMFFRVPLFDPDPFLKRMLPFVKPLFSVFGLLLWVAVVVGGVKVVIDNFPALRVQSQGILSLTNIPLLYAGLILIKALHEFGHAFAVRRFGGEVHTMGIMFLVFNPLPYVDATAAWAFRSKGRRVLVGAAGMLVEIFVASLAAFVWANTGPGVVRSLAYNMMFIASVSTILFNINPLLRFDGYYILSDLLDIPNLHTQASTHLRHLVERYAFGYRESRSPAASPREAFWLTVFGILSGIYKLVVFTTILLFVADRLLILGILMAAFCAVAWVLVPFLRFIRYLAINPRLERSRLRAVLVSLVFIAGVVSIFYFVPFPSSFRSAGVLEATEYALVVNRAEGRLVDVLAPPGTRVETGQPLLQLENPELESRIREVTASLREVQAMWQKAMTGNQADLRAVESLMATIISRRNKLLVDRELLTVRADIDGLWVSPQIEDLMGVWLRRGSAIGELVDDSRFYFASVVTQRDVSEVFSEAIQGLEIRLAGQAAATIPGTSHRVIPVEQSELPSIALGYGGGGDLPVNMAEGGMIAAEPFYEVRVDIAEEHEAALFHGRSGRVRFELPPEPLLTRWYRRLRQLLQERYQL